MSHDFCGKPESTVPRRDLGPSRLRRKPSILGDRPQIGPGVRILTADHPREASQREAGFEFARPIRIGCNVRIGGGALILPGVTVGDRAIIGAGSVVTRDVAEGTTVVRQPRAPARESAALTPAGDMR